MVRYVYNSIMNNPILRADSLPRIMPFALYILMMVVTDVLAQFTNNVDIRWIYVIKVTAIATLLWYLRKSYKELYVASSVSIWCWASAIVCGVLVFIAWVNLNASWMVLGDIKTTFNPYDGDALNWSLVFFRLTGAALVVPLMEELFWRSFLMRWLVDSNFLAVSPQRISVYALLVSSALFAVEHDLWFAGLIAGLVYGLLYIRSGNLWLSILAHVVTNGMLGCWVLYTGGWHYW